MFVVKNVKSRVSECSLVVQMEDAGRTPKHLRFMVLRQSSWNTTASSAKVRCCLELMRVPDGTPCVGITSRSLNIVVASPHRRHYLQENRMANLERCIARFCVHRMRRGLGDYYVNDSETSQNRVCPWQNVFPQILLQRVKRFRIKFNEFRNE